MTRRRRLAPLVAIFGSAVATVDGAIVKVGRTVRQQRVILTGSPCAPFAPAGVHVRRTEWHVDLDRRLAYGDGRKSR